MRMQVKRFSGSTSNRSLAVGLAAGFLLASSAVAADKYQASMVSLNPTASGISFSKSGKVAFKATKKPGAGGLETQLVLSGVDCPPNNDGATAGKCGVSGNPQTDHVLELGVSSLDGQLDLDGIAGVRLDIEKGKAVFQATGKNKIGGAAFGSLVTLIFGQPLGIGIVRVREPGTDPSVCDTVPLVPPGQNNNDCLDGEAYGIAGVRVETDPSLVCTVDSDCGVTATCESGLCTPEPCTNDTDCDEGGGVGSGECGSNGDCCDPGLDPTCAGQVP